jgi:antitoxin component YwqK of YwqJK toxin-antitoxin module
LVPDETDKSEPDMVIDDLDGSRHEAFFDNGNIRLSVELKNGVKHGTYKEYYENGEMKVRGRYRNDLMDGTWRYFDENGKVSEIREYQEGELKE